MKQHITVEQIQELSPKGKERLIAWVQSKIDSKEELIMYIDQNNHSFSGGKLISIGQMIEFLDEKTNSKGWLISNVFVNGTGLFTLEKPEEEGYWSNHPMFYIELCDVLWKAVKEVLEK